MMGQSVKDIALAAFTRQKTFVEKREHQEKEKERQKRLSSLTDGQIGPNVDSDIKNFFFLALDHLRSAAVRSRVYLGQPAGMTYSELARELEGNERYIPIEKNSGLGGHGGLGGGADAISRRKREDLEAYMRANTKVQYVPDDDDDMPGTYEYKVCVVLCCTCVVYACVCERERETRESSFD
jgi:hypothetical protein